MNKLLILFAVVAATASAQSYTAISATHVSNSSGGVLSVGKLCFVPSVPLTAQGAGSSVTSVCGSIVNGALSGGGVLQVPNLATASPAGTTYTIQVIDSSSGVGSFVLWVPGINSVTGASWSLDTFAIPAGVVALGVAPPLIQCTTGAVYVQSGAAPNNSRWSCLNGTWQSTTGQTSGGGGGTSIPLPVSVANGGTGTSTPSLIAGQNISITGNFPNQTISTSSNVSTSQTNIWTAGTQDWSQVAVSKPVVAVSTTPTGSCDNVASFETNTNASVANLYECVGGSWQLISSSSSGITSLVGDVVGSGVGSVTTTLATVNATPGTFGTSIAVPVITVDQKGRVTTVSTAAIPSSNYQAVEVNGTSQTPRANLNFASAGTVSLSASDNGTDTTTVTISATGSGGGGGGASLATQLLDFAPGTGTTTSIPFGSSCNGTTPCYVSLGGSRYSFTGAVTLGISSGTASDTVYFYVDNSGKRTVGYNSANVYTCSGCENTPISSISAFPAGSYPLYRCPVVSGVLSSSTCVDSRPILAATPLQGSMGIGITQSGNTSTAVLAETVRTVTGTSDVLSNTDCGNAVTYSNASSVAVVIGQAGLGQFLNGCVIELHNYGAGTVTITPSGSTIAGATTLALSQGNGQRIISDGANYQIGAGGSSSGGGGSSFNGGTVTTPIIVNSASAPAYTAEGGGATGFNVYDVTADTIHYQFGSGGSSTGLGNQFYLWDKTANVKRWHVDSTGLFKVDSGLFGILGSSTAPPCTATSDIGNLWFNTTTTTTASEWCGAVSGVVGWQSFGSGGGGSNVLSGAYSAIPGTCTTGQVYNITSGYFSRAVCSSTNVWTYYYAANNSAITPAGTLGLTTAGNTTATITNSNTNGYENLTVHASGSNDWLRTFGYTYSGSGTDSKQFVFVPPVWSNVDNTQLYDVVFGDSSSNYVGITCGVGNANISGSTWCESVHYSSAGTATADTYFNQGMSANVLTLRWMPFNNIRAQFDGTNLIFSACTDTNACATLFSEPYTAHLAASPTKLGYGIRNSTASDIFTLAFIGVQ